MVCLLQSSTLFEEGLERVPHSAPAEVYRRILRGDYACARLALPARFDGADADVELVEPAPPAVDRPLDQTLEQPPAEASEQEHGPTVDQLEELFEQELMAALEESLAQGGEDEDMTPVGTPPPEPPEPVGLASASSVASPPELPDPAPGLRPPPPSPLSSGPPRPEQLPSSPASAVPARALDAINWSARPACWGVFG
eukprot:4722437-Alexandrium_andersonii.AAC.1